jgi:methylthioribose-1-phosphate isomerase
VIDQQKLPFEFGIKELRSVDDVYDAISDMTVRGAPLIGATAAFGMYLSTLEITPATVIREHLANAARYLISSRPTAVNLSWAVNYVLKKIEKETSASVSGKALDAALEICEKEKENCRQLGLHGLNIIEEINRKKNGETVNILTHCNAGWLACIDYGTATAPIYFAREKGIDLHVWVDETRPRNQGSKLTAWELGENNVPYTLVADNTGGHPLVGHRAGRGGRADGRRARSGGGAGDGGAEGAAHEEAGGRDPAGQGEGREEDRRQGQGGQEGNRQGDQEGGQEDHGEEAGGQGGPEACAEEEGW